MPYKPQLKLYDHQAAALRHLEASNAFALLMGMRTGKTAVIITEFGQRFSSGASDQLLVIAPAGVYKTWSRELEKHMPPEVFRKLIIHTWQSGKKLPPTNANVFLVNVEALSTMAAAQEACYMFLSRRRTIMVIDESTTIKNPVSKRTKAVMKLAPLAKHRRILSGLPTPRSPLDLFSQFWFLDPNILGFSNYMRFRARYAVMRKIMVGRRAVQIVVGYKNIEELHRKIMKASFRVRLEDCYDVPPKAYIIRDVPMTKEQQRLYNEIKKYATAQLSSGDHVTANEVIAQIMRLHQICCGHVTDEEGGEHAVPSHRLKELLALLEECDGKVVIWCSYKRDVEAIASALQKEYGQESIAVFFGGNKNGREQESLRFETDEACRFMIATPGSGGRGRTWSQAGVIVYYSSTDNLEHRDQSEERASGIGKAERVTVIDLITRGTVEEKILKALRNKIDMAATITGDNWREWVV